jgi:ribose transport system substrate-binding protein
MPKGEDVPKGSLKKGGNKMKFARILLASAAVLAMSLGSVQAKDTKKIGLAVANLQANFFNQIKQSVEDEAKKRGIQVVTVDAKGDGPTQINQIQDLLTQNIDALIYIPAGAAAASVPVKLAKNAGIPVVNVDRNADGAPGDTFLATDSVASAKAVCDYILKQAGGKGKMVIIHGQKGTTPEVDRSKGCAESLKANPGVKVVAEQYSNMWAQDEGFQIMQNMLQANPDVSIVFAQADALALGAAQAIKVANPSQKIVVGGFDGDTAALEALSKGVFDVTATQQTQKMGRDAVANAVKLVAGEKVPAVQLMDATLTTKENVAGFIANHP